MPDQTNGYLYLLLAFAGAVGGGVAWFGKVILVPLKDRAISLMDMLEKMLVMAGRDISEIKVDVSALKDGHELLVKSQADLHAKIKCPVIPEKKGTAHVTG